MTARSIPDQVRDALHDVAHDAEDRNAMVAVTLRTLAAIIDDQSSIKLRQLIR